MINPLEQLLPSLDDTDTSVSLRWATVTSLSPLRVRLDTEDTAIDGRVMTLIRGLRIGQRVYVAWQGRRIIILGSSEWTPPPAQSWNLSQFLSGSLSGELDAVLRGNLVEINGAFSGTAFATQTSPYTVASAMPNSIRPTKRRIGTVSANGVSSVAAIEPNGQIIVWNRTAVSWGVSTVIDIHIMYHV